MDAEAAPQADSGSIRDALNAAFDSVESQPTPGKDLPPPIIAPEKAEPAQPTKPPPPGPARPEPSEPKAPEKPLQPGEKPRDAQGRFAKGTPETPKSPIETIAPPIEPASPPAPEFKPPQSWKPTEREKWGVTPPEIQAAITRREREIATAMQESTEARRGWQAFREVVSPFEGMIRAEGSEPLRAVATLLQTAAALRTAPAGHKAALIADLVKTYQVPVELLDKALVGEAPNGQQGPMQEYRDPRVDQLLSQLQQAAHQRQQMTLQKSHAEVDAFGKDKEFFADVREEMADILELAAKRNVAMSLEDAYSRALAMHPDIAEVLRQREAAKQAANANASTQRARQAAVSIRSQPTGARPAPQSQSLREDLEAAFLEVDGR
jgi:hypothetical protein